MVRVITTILYLSLLLLVIGLPPDTAQQNVTYYVTPDASNTNASCFGRKPCHTLLDYLQGGLDFSSQNVSRVTLMFETGTHELNVSSASTPWSILGLDQLTLVGASNDAKPKIKLSLVPVQIHDIPTVQIRDLMFADGGCGVQLNQTLYDNPFYGMLQVNRVDTFEVSNCIFCHNCYSTLYVRAETQLTVRKGLFTANTRSPFVLVNCVANFFDEITFIGNEMASSSQTGGAINAYFNAIITFNGNIKFMNNTASAGGAIYALNSSLAFRGLTYFRNNSANTQGGAIALCNSTVAFVGNTSFSNNVAVFGGSVYAYYSSSIFTGNTSFIRNFAQYTGGALFALGSEIKESSGSLTFEDNRALYIGGAMALSESTIDLLSEGWFFYNSAPYGGSALLLQSDMRFSGNHTFTANEGSYGGGLFLFRSSVTCSGSVSFIENSASISGGGLYLAGDSVCNFMPNASMYLTQNYARRHGGAVSLEGIPFAYCTYATDPLSLGIFSQLAETAMIFPRCFFQTPAGDPTHDNIHLIFDNNFAEEGGTAIYGSQIDFCTVTGVSQGLTSSYVFDVLAEFTAVEIDHVSNIQLMNHTTRRMTQTLSTISSDPYLVCPCYNGIPDCSTHEVDIDLAPGVRLTLSLVAVGERSGTVPTIIRGLFEDESSAHLGELEHAQTTDTSCKELHYTIFSQPENRSETQALSLFAEGACSNVGRPFRVVINFTDCPIGFDIRSGACNCSDRLATYTSSCNVTDEMILHSRESTFWAGLDDQTGELVTYPNCPFGYCMATAVTFSLQESHLLCDSNRAGLLCGRCSNNSSLVFGTSKCKKCPSNKTLALLIPFALAGVVLVAFLLIFRLTVAIGTTNALIFYANIIADSRGVLFPQSPNPLTVFISWINLDLGIETCFFKGMDAYDRTWLQFVFPVYLWIMVGFIIFASYYIPKFARIFGSNPVAVLATIFLLSYAKILRTIIASFSFATLEYPDDKTRTAWVYDANLPFLRGKHLGLFVIAFLVFVFLYMPYTLLLFCHQWLQAKSNYRFLRWINSPVIRSLLDAYQAPYKEKHRYWVGLLLIKRSVLLIMFATNVTGDPNKDLLVITLCGSIVAFVCWNIGGVYKKWYLNLIDSYFFTKLVVFAAVTYFVRGTRTNLEDIESKQSVVSNVLLSMDLVVFLAIVVYHAYLQISQTHVWNRLNQKKRSSLALQESVETESLSLQSSSITANSPSKYVTFSILREPLLDDEGLMP